MTDPYGNQCPSVGPGNHSLLPWDPAVTCVYDTVHEWQIPEHLHQLQLVTGENSSVPLGNATSNDYILFRQAMTPTSDDPIGTVKIGNTTLSLTSSQLTQVVAGAKKVPGVDDRIVQILQADNMDYEVKEILIKGVLEHMKNGGQGELTFPGKGDIFGVNRWTLGQIIDDPSRLQK